MMATDRTKRGTIALGGFRALVSIVLPRWGARSGTTATLAATTGATPAARTRASPPTRPDQSPPHPLPRARASRRSTAPSLPADFRQSNEAVVQWSSSPSSPRPAAPAHCTRACVHRSRHASRSRETTARGLVLASRPHHRATVVPLPARALRRPVTHSALRPSAHGRGFPTSVGPGSLNG